MKERGILFQAPLVRALLSGAKTQTRRLMKPQPITGIMDAKVFAALHGAGIEEAQVGWTWKGCRYEPWPAALFSECPYGVPGDRLWVRETWYCDHAFERDYELTANSGRVGPRVEPDKAACEAEWREQLYYRADGEAHEQFEQLEGSSRIWKPGIHMPRWASRITLEVTEVRVLRLHQLTEEDAKAEDVEPIGDVGCPCEGDDNNPGSHFASCAWSHLDVDPDEEPHRAAFAVLWDAINGDKAPWSSNPWVWCVTFKRVELP